LHAKLLKTKNLSKDFVGVSWFLLPLRPTGAIWTEALQEPNLISFVGQEWATLGAKCNAPL